VEKNQTRKCSNCDALQLEAVVPVLMPFNYDAHAKFLIAESVCCCPIAFHCWYIVTLTFDPMTLTFELWLWTFLVYRLCCGQTMYQIWAQSSNPWWSYCHFNMWANDLELLLCVVLGSGIIFEHLNSVQLSVTDL